MLTQLKTDPSESGRTYPRYSLLSLVVEKITLFLAISLFYCWNGEFSNFYKSFSLLEHADDIYSNQVNTHDVNSALSRLDKEVDSMGLLANIDKSKYFLSSEKMPAHSRLALM